MKNKTVKILICLFVLGICSHAHAAPSSITNLSALKGDKEGQIKLYWTAPSGGEATVVRYIIKWNNIKGIDDYGLANTAEGWFNLSSTHEVPNTLTPLSPGKPEFFVVTGLIPNTTYYFAVKSVDSDSATSPIDDNAQLDDDDVAGIQPPLTQAHATSQIDVSPPLAVTDLTAITHPTMEGALMLSWTAPAEETSTYGNVAATKYYIKYADKDIDVYFGGDINAWWGWANTKWATGVPSPSAPGTTQSLVISALTAGTTYYFGMKSEDEKGLISLIDLNAQAGGLPQANARAQIDVTPPSQLTGLTALQGMLNGVIDLSWIAPGDDGTNKNITGGKYSIRWSTYTGFDWDDLDNFVAEFSTNTIPGRKHYFSITGLTYGTSYFFRIKTADEVDVKKPTPDHRNWSVASKEVWAIAPTDVMPPAAITNLSALTGNLEGYISLSWTAPKEDGAFGGKVQSYIIKYSPGPYRIDYFGGDDNTWWGFLNTKEVSNPPEPLEPGRTQSLVVTGLNAGVTYYFAIKSIDDNSNISDIDDKARKDRDDGGVAPTYQANARAQKDVTPPAPITTITALPGENEGEVDLEWTATGDDGIKGPVTNGAFRIQCSNNPSYPWNHNDYRIQFSSPLINPGDIFSRTVTGLTGGVTYFFRVWMRDEVLNSDKNWSALSRGVTAWAQADLCPPAAVTNLSALSGVDEGEIDLTWSAPGDDVWSKPLNPGSKYRIQYSSYIVTWNVFSPYNIEIPTHNVKPGDFQLRTVTGLTGGVEYYFRLWTKDETAANWSGLSNGATATARVDLVVPDAINTLAASPGTNEGEISLSWQATGDDGEQGDITGGMYHIKYSANPSIDWTRTSSGGENISFSTNTAPSAYQKKVISGLLPGTTYYFGLWLRDESVSNWSSISKGATMWAQNDVAVPEPVTDLKADRNGCVEGQVHLSWTAPDEDEGVKKGRPADVYMVRRATFEITAARWDSADVWDVTGEPAPSLPASIENMIVKGLTPGVTYYFAMKSRDEVGNTSGIDTISPRPKAWAQYDITSPAAITDLAAVPAGAGEVELRWTAPGDDVTAGTAKTYMVKYNFVKIDDGNWNTSFNFYNVWVPTSPALIEARTVTGLSSDTTYYFAIKTKDERNNTSLISNSPCAKTIDTVPPANILSITALPGNTEGKIDLVWSAPGDNGMSGKIESGEYMVRYASEGTTVEWSTGSTAGYCILIATSNVNPLDTQRYALTGLTAGVTYYFRLWTRDEVMDHWSGISKGVTTWAQRDVTRPSAITDLSALTGEDEGEIDLSWTAPGDDGTKLPLNPGKFGIKYSQDPGYNWGSSGFNVIIGTSGVAPGEKQFYTLTGLADGSLYYMRVYTADERDNWSYISNGATTYSQVDFTAPSAVTNLTALTGAVEGEIVLSWSAPGDDGTRGKITSGHYRIQYASYTVQWSTASYNISITTYNVNRFQKQVYVVTGLKPPLYAPGTTFYFRLWTADARDNWSDLSNPVTAMAQIDVTKPSAVNNLSAAKGAVEGEVKLSWTAPGDDGTKNNINGGFYGIKYSTWTGFVWGGPSGFDRLWSTDSVPGEAKSFTVTGLKGGTSWYFRLWAADEIPNWSDISNQATSWPQMDVTPPANLTTLSAVVGANEGEIALSWTAPGDDGFKNILSTGTYRIKYRMTPPPHVWNKDDYDIQITTRDVSPYQKQYYAIKSLLSGTTYYINTWVYDELMNFSGFSNTATSYAQYDVAPPVTITDLVADRAGCIEGQVHLSWSAPDEDRGVPKARKAASYAIKYATSPFDESSWNSGWVKNAKTAIAAPQNPGLAENRIITGLTPGVTCYFGIRSTDERGNVSDISSPLASAWAQLDVTVPSAITDLAASQLTTPGEIRLSWTAPGDDGTVGTASSYIAKWNTVKITTSNWDASSGFVQGWEVHYTGTKEIYAITGLSDDTVFYFAVKTEDELGNISDISNSPSAKTKDVKPPSAVTDLYATQGTKQGEVKLIWTSPGDNGTCGDISGGMYRIQYSTYDITFTTAGPGIRDINNVNVAPSTYPRTYTVTGLTRGVTYYFRLWTADEEMNWSPESNETSTWAMLDSISPGVLRYLVASTGAYEGEANLRWIASGDDVYSGIIEDGEYRIQRPSYTAGVVWSPSNYTVSITTHNVIPGATQVYTLKNLVPGVTYYIKVWVRDEVPTNWSPDPVTVQAWAQWDKLPPAKITDLTALSSATEGGIDLAWTAPGDDGTTGHLNGKYEIRYYTIEKGTSTKQISANTEPYDRQFYTLTDLWEGNTYYMDIRTFDDRNNASQWSNIASAFVTRVPPPPLTTTVTDNGNVSVTVDWTRPYVYDFGGYHIYRSSCSFSNNQLGETRALWQMDEGSGSKAYDYTYYKNHGTLSNTTWVDGKFGKALSFNGSDRSVVINSSSSLDMGENNGDELTIEAWVYPKSLSSIQVIMARAKTWFFGINSDGKLRFHQYYLNGSRWDMGQVVYSASALTINAWNHVVVKIKDTVYLKFFIDGVLSGESSGYNLGAYTWYSGQNFYLGLDGGTGGTVSRAYPLNGYLDEVRVSRGPKNSFLVGTDYNVDGRNWLDSNVVEGKTYWYAVAVFDRTKNEDELVTSVKVTVDATRPGPVQNLSAISGTGEGEIDLSWTAPGDDGTVGKASLYTIKYATFSILSIGGNTTNWWNLASNVTGKVAVPLPSTGGAAEHLTVPNLSAGVTYYFAIKTQDEVPLTSWIDVKAAGGSQARAKAQIDLIPPAKLVKDPAHPYIRASYGAVEGSVNLEWEAPGDDMMSKNNAGGIYDIRYSTMNPNLAPFDGDTTAWWNQAHQVSNEPAPAGVWSVQNMAITGLAGDTRYYFGMRTADEYYQDKPGSDHRNWSYVSDVVDSFTRDYIAPQPPTQLTALSGNFNVTLTWTAPEYDENGRFIDSGSNDLAGYRVYRGTYPGFYVPALSPAIPPDPKLLIAQILNKNTTTYIDEPADTDRWYYYVVTAIDIPRTSPPGPPDDVAYTGRNESNSSMVVMGMKKADDIPPAAITTLYAWTGANESEIELSWFAPGDDGTTGNITKNGMFGIKWSTWTKFDWDGPAGFDKEISTSPIICAAGYGVKLDRNDGLEGGTTYYFRIWTRDDVGNWSEGLSNGATAMAQVDMMPPAPITDLRGETGVLEGDIRLYWTSTGDDGYSGAIQGGKYRVQCSSYVSEPPSWWDSGNEADWMSYPGDIYKEWNVTVSSLTPQSIVIGGLQAGTSYYVRIWTRDESVNWSDISNGATVWSQIDIIPPAAVSDLYAKPGANEGEIDLSWTAPGDDGTAGSTFYGCYLIRWTTYSFVSIGEWGSPLDENPFWNTRQQSITKDINAGTKEERTIHNLTGGVTYYFRLWTGDEISLPVKTTRNWSSLSNEATSWAQVDVCAPSAITTLSALTGKNEGEIDLSWISPGDDGTEKRISGGVFGIKYSTQPGHAWESDPKDFGYVFDCVMQDIGSDPGQEWKRTLYNLDPGTSYYIRIWTRDESVNWSSISNGATAMAQVDVMPPAPITDLKAETGKNEGDIILSWTSPGDDGTNRSCAGKYGIKYTTSPVYEWPVKPPANFAVYFSTCGFLLDRNISYGSTETLKVSNLIGGVTYYFRVWTQDNSNNWSDLSNGATAMAQIDVAPPCAITNLSALTGKNEGEIDLSWTAPGDDGSEGDINGGAYRIKYSTSQTEPWAHTNYSVEIPTSVAPGQRSCYTFRDLSGGVTYYFRVWTADETGNWSGISNGATAMAQVDVCPPAAVTTLKAFTGKNEGEIDLSWISPGDDGTMKNIVGGRYGLKWSSYTSASFDWDGPQNFEVEWATSTAPDKLQMKTIKSLKPGVTYYFRLWTADEKLNWSGISNEATAWAQVDVCPPAAVTTLSGLPGRDEGQIDLSWCAPGDDGTLRDIVGGKFGIKYSTDKDFDWDGPQNFTFSLPDVNSAPGQKWKQTFYNLIGGATYYFRLWTADDNNNWSPVSNAATTWAQVDVCPPAAITTLSSLTGQKEGEVDLSWISPGDDGTGPVPGSLEDQNRLKKNGVYVIKYTQTRLYKWEKDDYDNTKIPGTIIMQEPVLQPGNLEKLTLSGLSGGSTYYFRIWTQDDAGNWSNISNGATAWAMVDVIPPAAITSLFSLTGAVEGRVELSWTAPGDDGTEKPLVKGSGYLVRFSTAYVASWSTGAAVVTIYDMNIWDSKEPKEFPDIVGWRDGKYLLSVSTGFPANVLPGDLQSVQVKGLRPGVTYYFRIWTRDEAGNISLLSNGATAQAQIDTTPPAPVGLTGYKGDITEQVVLYWTAPGDDWDKKNNLDGIYDVRYASFNARNAGFRITDDIWDYLIQVPSTTIEARIQRPQDYFLNAGVRFTVTGLRSDWWYYFAVRTADEFDMSKPTPDHRNWSSVSNTAEAKTEIMAPRQVVGIRASLSGDARFVTLEWEPVTANEDGSPCDDLLGYNIWRVVGDLSGKFELMGSTPTVSASSSTWTDAEDVSGGVHYYKVTAVDFALNASQESMIADTSEDMNIIVIAGGGDFTRIMIPQSASDVLYKGTNVYRKDLKIKILPDTSPPLYRFIKSFRFVAMADDNEVLEDFMFRKARPQVLFTYREDDVSSLVSSGISGSALERRVAIFWHNGKDWIRIGGSVDTSLRTVSIKSTRLGKYMIRTASAVENLIVNSVTPRILTPNGDGKNDVLNIQFDYPTTGDEDVFVTARIYDIRGAYLTDMTVGPTKAGDKVNSASWDCRRGGEVVLPGVYIYQIEVAGEVANGTVVIAK